MDMAQEGGSSLDELMMRGLVEAKWIW